MTYKHMEIINASPCMHFLYPCINHPHFLKKHAYNPPPFGESYGITYWGYRMKALISSAIAIVFCAVLFSVLPIHGEDVVYRETIRLHVLAHSNSAADQSVKLSVRDAVLECVDGLIGNSASHAHATAILAESGNLIRNAADTTLRTLGTEERSTVRFGEEWYPTRMYNGFTLPAGMYTSLRVEIGDANGKNWWCILFPSVCSRFARGKEDADALVEEFVAAGFTPEEYRLITENENMPYKVRFWVLEKIATWFGHQKNA